MTGPELLLLSLLLGLSLCLLLPKPKRRSKKRRKPIAKRARFQAKNNEFKTYFQKQDAIHKAIWLENEAARMRADQTAEEAIIFALLLTMGVHFKPQFVMHNRETGACCIVDFYLPKHSLVIEADGFQHKQQRQYDQGRDKWIKEFSGARVLRYWNGEIRAPGFRDRLQKSLGVHIDNL